VIATKHDETASGEIVPVISPSENEIAQILGLKERCEQRNGIRIILSDDFLRSLDKAGVGAFGYRMQGRFVGFVFFYSFEEEEAEASIFADPDIDWKRVVSLLLEAAMIECRRRGQARLLFMNDRRSSSNAELFKNAGGVLAFSEHRMVSHGTPITSGQHIDFQEVSNEDATLRDIELECHDHFYSKPDQTRYLAIVEGRPVGKIDVNEEGTETELTGFCVVPRLRGKGLGKAILLGMVGILRAEGKEIITLDVQTDNDIALSLYLKSGFEKEFTIDYYAVSLKDMNSNQHH
jgi:ribosomal protein S18 acetylase RimI-like enzyme